MKKLTVTIGIPAYNEAENIIVLIQDIFRQRTHGFTLDKVIVASDGSTDKTDIIVSQVANKKVILVSDTKRLGKPARINQIFGHSNSDVVVILDADIRLASDNVISLLVTPFIGTDVALTSGKSVCLHKKTFVQDIIYHGLQMWEETKLSALHGEMYTCEGQIRAFSKALYTRMRFPDASADDVYPYLYCKQHNLSYRYVENAKIYYRIPQTVHDYVKQHSRFLLSQSIQGKYFDEDIITGSYVITLRTKLRIVLKYIIRYPLLTLFYLFIMVIPKFNTLFKRYDERATWSIIGSTKGVV